MKILIAGGSGFIGGHLKNAFIKDGHEVWILSRKTQKDKSAHYLKWDAKTTTGWADVVNEMDVIINLAGQTFATFPWTKATKEKFSSSRINAGEAIVSAVKEAHSRPKLLIQASGIGYYGNRPQGFLSEAEPAGDTFSARLAVQTEDSTRAVEALGVRQVGVRTGLVFARRAGLFPLFALPARLFFGGRFGDGKQGLSWIHLEDYVGAIRFLISKPEVSGAFNLSAPEPVPSGVFLELIAKGLKRPFWFHIPSGLLHLGLGEMSDLLLESQFVIPKRLQELGYIYKFSTAESAVKDLIG